MTSDHAALEHDIAQWDFASSAKNSAAVKEELAQTLSRGVKQVKQQFLIELNQNNLLAGYVALFPKFVVRERNLAHTMAIHWITMWCTIHQSELPNDQSYQSVVAQCSKRLIGDPNAKNADKRQKMGEATMYESVFAMEAMKRAREAKDPQVWHALSAQAHSNCSKRGLDFKAMQLTSDGFSGLQATPSSAQKT